MREQVNRTTVLSTREGKSIMFGYGKYFNDDNTLKDDEVLHDMKMAIDMYKDGEIVEAGDLLNRIVNAIRECQ